MAGSKGKTKGNTGELKIAKFLTELYGHKFLRVPNSGAYLGASNFHRRASLDETQASYFKSDLIPPSHMRRLVVESKFYKDFPFHKLGTDQPIPQLDKWVEQTLATVESGDTWFLVIRINHKGSFAVFDKLLLADLQVANHVVYGGYIWCDFEPLFRRNRDSIAQRVATPCPAPTPIQIESSRPL